MNTSKPTKIFISHSSNDLEYMRAFTDLLNNIHIPAESIVCTSIERYIIPNGENIYDWLRHQFIDFKLHMIFALSDNYYNSCASLNEMGAAWVTATNKDLLLLPGFKFEDIKGCIDKNTAGISLDSDEKLLKTRLGALKNYLISELALPPVLDVDWENYRDRFIEEVHNIAESKKNNQRQNSIDASLIESTKTIERQPIPKFEIKIDGYNGAYSNLRLSIKNVSNVFVSGLKGISFNILNKSGNPCTYADDHTPIPVPKKFEFKDTSIASGAQTSVQMDTHVFYRQNYSMNPITNEKLKVSLVPQDIKVEFVFLCEDEYGEEYKFKAETVIPSANEHYKGIWKCGRID